MGAFLSDVRYGGRTRLFRCQRELTRMTLEQTFGPPPSAGLSSKSSSDELVLLIRRFILLALATLAKA